MAKSVGFGAGGGFSLSIFSHQGHLSRILTPASPRAALGSLQAPWEASFPYTHHVSRPDVFPHLQLFPLTAAPQPPASPPAPLPSAAPGDAALLASGASVRGCCFLLPFQFRLFLRCGAQTGAALSLGWNSRASLQMRFRKAVWESFCTAHPQTRAANPSLV